MYLSFIYTYIFICVCSVYVYVYVYVCGVRVVNLEYRGLFVRDMQWHLLQV